MTGPQDPGPAQETRTEVYVLPMPGGQTYTGQPWHLGPEPEAQ